MRRFSLCLFLLLGLVLALPMPVRADGNVSPPDPAEMERLARDKPLEFLERCLRHYDRTVTGYTLVMQKQERLDGKLQPTEVIEASLREKPFGVYLHWLQGTRLAEAALYVEGENDGKMLVRPALALARSLIVPRDPESAEAKKSGRYAIKEFGLRQGMERTLMSWKDANERGQLHVEFLGEVRVKEAGNRPCLALRRTRYARPETDGVTQLTIYVDRENWLQVGSVLKGEEGKVIGAYFFRDIRLNPDFKAEQFKREGLRP